MTFTDVLTRDKRFVLANQLLRSGTSVGAMIEEAQTPESRADFIHKCKIAHKEARESAYWMRLCRKSPDYPNPLNELEDLAQSCIRVLDKIIQSARVNESYK